MLEDEEKLKSFLKKKFPKEREIMNSAFAQMEAGLNFAETKWEKGLMLLNKLDELGYKIVKK